MTTKLKSLKHTLIENKDIKDVIEVVSKTDNKIVLIHGCNCFNTMSKGLAKRLSDLFPQIIDADNTTKKGDWSKLSSFTYSNINDNLTIVNLYSQYNYGGGINVSYPSLDIGFKSIISYFGDDVVYVLPLKIGAGLAGGSSDIVKEIIDCNFINNDLVLFDL